MASPSTKYRVAPCEVPYEQGRRAFRAGLGMDQNPYSSAGGRMSNEFSVSRQYWFNGWLDEMRWSKYGPNCDEVYDPLEGDLL